ncbi:hypothetical protein J2S62_002286 [Enteractinococcus fodinae]|uniref:Uncharacterized protein n=1 Tax=Enteractinococcus fodinae TaxID=684663 RepID=A0ABU2B353_9MICC|nr:hypothetical protein [Enteractinococcus fodinae]
MENAMLPRKFFALIAAAAIVGLTSCGGEAGRADADTPPAFSEIENDIWGSMAAAGSVTIERDMALFAISDPTASLRFDDIYGESDAPFENRGMLDGSGSSLHRDGHELARVFPDDVMYLTGGAVLSMFEGGEIGLDSFAELDRTSVPDDLMDVWVEPSPEIQDFYSEGAFNVGDEFYGLHRMWYGEDSPDHAITRDHLTDQGTAEIRNDKEVWVYPGEYMDQELVIESNHETPRLVSLSYPLLEMHFKDWGETEAPERPDEADVISLDEFEERVLAATSDL